MFYVISPTKLKNIKDILPGETFITAIPEDNNETPRRVYMKITSSDIDIYIKYNCVELNTGKLNVFCADAMVIKVKTRTPIEFEFD